MWRSEQAVTHIRESRRFESFYTCRENLNTRHMRAREQATYGNLSHSPREVEFAPLHPGEILEPPRDTHPGRIYGQSSFPLRTIRLGVAVTVRPHDC
jgi:hypothetical protein